MSESHDLFALTHNTTPFKTELSRHYITVRNTTGQVLFSLPRIKQPLLYCRNENVCMKTQYSTTEEILYPAQTAMEARHLLNSLVDALHQYTAFENELLHWMRKTAVCVVIGIIAGISTALWLHSQTSDYEYAHHVNVQARLSEAHDSLPLAINAQNVTPEVIEPTEDNQPYPAETLPAPQAVQQQAPAAVAPPAAIAQTTSAELTTEQRASLQVAMAGNLKKAAGRGMFSISLSSGHDRTLYVFADPLCPNCRIFEPGLQAMAGYFNVEVFPVTLVGKDATVRNVVPVLCAPKEARAVLWRNLFDMGAGMLHPDEQTQPLACVTGKDALAINDRALQVYRLPGTPTVIADDGRQVPLTAMKDIPALTAFLNHK